MRRSQLSAALRPQGPPAGFRALGAHNGLGQSSMGLKILVTGGAGYIGSHTCKALAAAGYEPVVLDNLSAGHRWAVKWGPLIVGDIADRPLVMETLKRFNVQAVIHFAAHGYVGESV